MMEILTSLLLILGAGLLVWFAFAAIKRQPEAFRADKLSKSIFTLGILALLLIGFIALLVFFLKH